MTIAKSISVYVITLLLALLPFVAQGQGKVTQLIDSLALVKSHSERSALALAISFELHNEDWSRAQQYIDIAEAEAISTKEDSVMARFHFEAGKIYQIKQAVDIALEYYNLAYEYYQATNNPTLVFKIENNLAIIYASIDNVEESLHYFKKVYHTLSAQNDSLRLAQILNNIGNIYFEIEPDSALVYFQKSYSISSSLNKPELMLYVYTNLGRAYHKLSQNDKAEFYYTKAVQTVFPEARDGLKAWVYISSATFHLDLNQNDSAIYYVDQALNAMGANKSPEFLQKTNSILYQAYYNLGDFEASANRFIAYDSISAVIDAHDEQLSKDRLIQVRDYKSRIQQQQLKANQKNFQLMLVGIGIVSLLIIGVMLYFRYKNHLENAELQKELAETKQRELNIELELKNKSLTLGAMNEIYKSNSIHEITKALQGAKLMAQKAETRNNIDKIIGRLKSNLDKNPWQEFETHFSEIHESFFQSLTTKHPELTPKDIRMCALLKMNLTTKEIAQLTGQSLKGVENARTRIRKKLELTNQKIDLSAYLNSI